MVPMNGIQSNNRWWLTRILPRLRQLGPVDSYTLANAIVQPHDLTRRVLTRLAREGEIEQRSCRLWGRKEFVMERRYYTAASLSRVLHTFERGYGIESDEFYRAHVAGEALEAVPASHRQAWAGFYRAWMRLSASSFADRAERELELA